MITMERNTKRWALMWPGIAAQLETMALPIWVVFDGDVAAYFDTQEVRTCEDISVLIDSEVLYDMKAVEKRTKLWWKGG